MKINAPVKKLLQHWRLEVPRRRLPGELPRPRPLGYSAGGWRRRRPMERHLRLGSPELGELQDVDQDIYNAFSE